MLCCTCQGGLIILKSIFKYDKEYRIKNVETFASVIDRYPGIVQENVKRSVMKAGCSHDSA